MARFHFISFSALHTLQNMKLPATQLQRRTVRFNKVILTNHLAMPPAPWPSPGPSCPPPLPRSPSGGTSQFQKSVLLLGLFSYGSSSGSLAVCPRSSDIPEEALSYTAQPCPPGPLPAKDSPDRTELFSPLRVFLPFFENVQHRNGI